MAENDYASMIVQLIWIIFFIMLFTGANQKIQMKLWSMDIRNKLRIIQRYVEEDKEKISRYIRNLGYNAPELLLKRTLDFFTIEPVDIEPTDIIRRLDHLIRTNDKSFRGIVESALPNIGRYEVSLVETSLSVVAALHTVYKVIRHYLLQGEKENNWILLMQLELIMPQIMRLVETYHKSLDAFTTGKPIGDGVGPLVAYRLVEEGEVVSKKTIDETNVYELRLDNRRYIVIKAEGPGSNVGHPGAVLARVVEELKGNIDLVVTVDAALKLEGEENGEIAEGVGAAIGDPGPEKIAIERAASKYGIPLRALVIKMGLAEAIQGMRKEIYEAGERAVEYIRRLVRELTPENATVIIAGIGNTMGVPG